MAKTCVIGDRCPMRSPPSVRSVLALMLSVVAVLLAVWIVIPAPNRLLLTLGVGAPEVSVWFMVLASGALMFALRDVRMRWSSRWAAIFALSALVLSAIPFLRFRTHAKLADTALRAALGETYAATLSPIQSALYRPQPLIVRDLFRGLRDPIVGVRITRNVAVVAPAGHQLTLDVYQPPTKGPHPVLVQVYGGAWQRGEPSNSAEFASYIASQGYVVFAVGYRHAPAVVFPAPVQDVQFMLSWIVAHATAWDSDATRMAIIGRSAGAHLAMMAAYADGAPNLRAVINYYGPVDLAEGYNHPPRPDPLRVRAVEEAFLGGTPDQMPDRYHAASPITLVTRRMPPTLLVYGGRDHIVEPRFGSLLATRLRGTGTTVVHVEIPWAEHAFDGVPHGPSNQLALYVTERFLAWAMSAR